VTRSCSEQAERWRRDHPSDERDVAAVFTDAGWRGTGSRVTGPGRSNRVFIRSCDMSSWAWGMMSGVLDGGCWS
jgi:hypothetical protein